MERFGWGKLMKPTKLQWGKNELLGSRAENYLDDRVLYKLFIGISLDAAERTLESVTREVRPSPSHNMCCSGKPLNSSESQFPCLRKGMTVPSSLDCNVDQKKQHVRKSFKNYFCCSNVG